MTNNKQYDGCFSLLRLRNFNVEMLELQAMCDLGTLDFAVRNSGGKCGGIGGSPPPP